MDSEFSINLQVVSSKIWVTSYNGIDVCYEHDAKQLQTTTYGIPCIT